MTTARAVMIAVTGAALLATASAAEAAFIIWMRSELMPDGGETRIEWRRVSTQRTLPECNDEIDAILKGEPRDIVRRGSRGQSRSTFGCWSDTVDPRTPDAVAPLTPTVTPGATHPRQ